MRNQTEMTELGVIRASVIDRGQGPRLLSLGVIIVPLNNQTGEKQIKKVNVAPRTDAYLFWLIIMNIKEDFILVQKGMNKHNVDSKQVNGLLHFCPTPGIPERISLNEAGQQSSTSICQFQKLRDICSILSRWPGIMTVLLF